MKSWKLGLVTLVGTAALAPLLVQVGAQAQPAAPAPCPRAGTYTADVDGAPDKGACRGFVDMAEPVSFNIPPGPLFDGLKAFLEQSGSRGMVPLDVMAAGLQTPGVNGTLQPRDALERLLSGTGVTYMQDQTGTFRFPALKDAAVPGGRCIWAKAQVASCPAQ